MHAAAPPAWQLSEQVLARTAWIMQIVTDVKELEAAYDPGRAFTFQVRGGWGEWEE